MKGTSERVIQHLQGIAAEALELLADLPARRRLIDRYFWLDGIEPEVVGAVTPAKIAHINVEWVCASHADPTKRMLYIHGGSWVSGTLKGYRALASRLSASADVAVLLVEYRLAPEHRFPAAIEDCVTAYQWMLENGPEGPSTVKNVFIGGDSAGGNLTLSTSVQLRTQSTRQPDAILAMSPATDFTGSSPSLNAKASLDPIIHPRVYDVLKTLYLNEEALDNPLVSPLYANYSDAPPMLLQVGEAEVLLDDTLRLRDKARLQGCDVEAQVWEGMPHVFQGFAPQLAEANEALAAAGQFIKRYAD